MNNNEEFEMLQKDNKEIKLLIAELRDEISKMRTELSDIKDNLEIRKANISNANELNDMVQEEQDNKDDPLGFKLS